MTATITVTAQPSNTPPRVQVTVGCPSGETGTSLTVACTPSGGSSRFVRDAEPVTLAGATTWTGWDYEAPIGVALTYSATLVTNAATYALTGDPVTITGSQAWLVSPGAPADSLPVTIRDLGEQSYPVAQQVFTPAGRSTPVVVSDAARKAAVSRIVLRTTTLTELSDLLTLLAGTSVMLLSVPSGLGLGQTADYAALGEVTVARPDGAYGSQPMRFVTIPYWVVDRPPGSAAAVRTWADLMAEAATWAGVMDRYLTWTGVAAGTAGT